MSYLGRDYDGHLAPLKQGKQGIFSRWKIPELRCNRDQFRCCSLTVPHKRKTIDVQKTNLPNKWESRYPIVRGKSQLLLSTLKKKQEKTPEKKTRWIFWEPLLNHIDPVDTTWRLLEMFRHGTWYIRRKSLTSGGPEFKPNECPVKRLVQMSPS